MIISTGQQSRRGDYAHQSEIKVHYLMSAYSDISASPTVLSTEEEDPTIVEDPFTEKRAILLFLLFTFGVFIIGYGAGFGSGFATDNKVNSDDNDDKNDAQQGFIVVDFCDLYTIDDFDSEPVPPVENIFFPNVTFPLYNSTEWPEDTYHPLLPEEDSPLYVHRYSEEYVADRVDPIQSFVQETNEYQISLDRHAWVNRTESLDTLLRIVGQFLGDYITQLNEPKESLYYEVQYEKHGCKASYSEYRVRSFFEGKKAGFSEIAINKDYDTKLEGMQTAHVLPHTGVGEAFEMKLEQDVHPCHYKYNRKLTLTEQEFGKEFDCEESKKFFPRIFYNASLFEENPLEIHSNKTWWTYAQTGYMFGNTTKFKCSCNVAYDTYEDAMSGTAVPNHSSEWSIRVYSFDDGFGVWDEYVLATMGEFYAFLLESYGSHSEDPHDC